MSRKRYTPEEIKRIKDSLNDLRIALAKAQLKQELTGEKMFYYDPRRGGRLSRFLQSLREWLDR